MKRMLFAALFVVTVFSAFGARTWYVATNGVDAAGYGLSPETPFRTINAASTHSDFADGDTILVAPGRYDSGFAMCEGNATTNRVYLPKRTILKATGNRDNTFIVGGSDPDSANGRGPGAIRCLYATVPGTTIEGFTLTDGHSGTTDAVSGYGPGIYAAACVYIVDCAITHCSGYGHVCYYGSAIRTLFACNTTTDDGSVGYNVWMYCCVCANNTSGGKFPQSYCYAYNCTFLNNGKLSRAGALYNCLVINGTSSTGTPEIRNTLLITDSIADLMGPACWDFRLRSGSEAIGAGDLSLSCGATGKDKTSGLLRLPEAYRNIDFNHQPILTEGSVSCGAVQEVATPVAGGFRALENLTLNDHESFSGSWAFPDAWPTNWQVGARLPSDGHLFGFKLDGEQEGRNAIGIIFPDLRNQATFVPPMDVTSVCTGSVEVAENVYWVDPTNGSDSSSGTEDAPFKTLQKAVGTPGRNVSTVVYAAPGDYAEGRAILGDDVDGVGSRLVFAASRRVLIRGAGVGRSFISGAADPNSGDNGPDAIRPIASLSGQAAVQGFSLRNGRSFAEKSVSDSELYGGIVSSESDFQILDCEIVGCGGVNGVVCGAHLIRSSVRLGSQGIYLFDANGGIAGAQAGFTAVPDGSSVTLSLDATVSRPCVGYRMNDETVLFSEMPSRTFTADELGADGAYVEAICTTDWYVDASKPDDSGNGFTPDTAKRTIKGLLDTGHVIDGDTIHAAEGFYDEGEMTGGADAAAQKRRVILPVGVTLQADGRAAETKIVGASDVAGVYLNERARLIGFTVCGCRASLVPGAGLASKSGWCAVAADCIVTDCLATFAGGASCVDYVFRSQFFGCGGSSLTEKVDGATAQYGRYYNCIFDKNGKKYEVLVPVELRNCTFGATGQPTVEKGNHISNSLLLRTSRVNNIFMNCYYSESQGTGASFDAACVQTNAEALALDAAYVPVNGSNVGIDHGNWDLYVDGYPYAYDPKGPEFDVYGNPRVRNGRMDVGAVEYGWLKDYAATLGGGRRFAVDDASSGVTNGTGFVAIPAGEFLTAAWNTSGGEADYSFCFRLTSGTLFVSINGVTTEYGPADMDQTVEFSSALAENVVNIVAGADCVGAEIFNFNRVKCGTVIVVR